VHVSRALLVLAAVLLVAGCAERGGGGSPAAEDLFGEWFLTEGSSDGNPLPRPAGPHATFTVGPDELSGRSFCNHYSSTYRLDGTALAVDSLAGTDMGCEPGVMAAETAYLSALGRADTVAHDGADLVLTGDGVRLRFSPVPPVPDRDLAGTHWVLDTLVDGDVAGSTSGDPATLVLAADRTLSGSTGCRPLSGRWALNGNILAVTELTADGDCPADVSRQDAHVTAVLGGGPRAGVPEDRLTLTGTDGRGLVYRAEG
jgi:heat shock protein HslJ